MNPLIVLNQNSWKIILESLQREVIKIAHLRGSTPAVVATLASQYSAIVNDNHIIFHDAVARITRYTNSYAIMPSGGVYDEFKNIYFLGMAISFQLEQNGLFTLNEFHQLAMLRLLDLRLVKPHGAHRVSLTNRIVQAIKNKTIQDHFGLYGWYLTYKCLYNAAEDAAGKKTSL